MGKLLKYLGEHKVSIFIIILLMIVQAYCDLALPQYTSDIVDVGIQQSGIANVSPEEISAETYDSLKLFLTEEEIAVIDDNYAINQKNIYELQTDDTEVIAEMDGIFGPAMLMLSSMSESGEMDVVTLKGMLDSGAMTKDDIIAKRDEVLSGMGDLSDSIITQKAILFVKAEYEKIGVDLDSIQNHYLFVVGAKMLGFTLVMMMAAIIAGLLAAKTAAKIGMDLRGRVFHKVVSFSNNELNHFSTASLITRSTNDIQQIQMVSVMLLRMVIYAPILGVGGIIKVASTKTGLGWIIGVGVGAIILLVTVLMIVAMPKFKKMQVLVDKLNLVSREILTGIPVIRAFSREKHEEKRFDVANKELMGTQLFTNRVMTVMMPVMMLIMNLLTLMIVWFGGKGIESGNLQVGDMMAFITYTMQIVISFLMLTLIAVLVPRAAVAAARIDEVISTKETIIDKAITKDEEIKDVKGLISFEHVNFKYEGADEDALTDITFTANPGETTAIIGSTGCGKSTLLHLIPRFYDVSQGSISIDGVDIRDLSQKKLHSLLGFVPQKGNLFSGTIESNIKFAGSWITDEQMKEAAEIAQATDFIQDKSEQYESEISQGGTNVSGGQKQRLSIARAIAKNPKVFLFDDSFSALDYKTDTALRKALYEKIKDATVIVVAQRISTILHADKIIVLDDGAIVGMGTHEELLDNCEAYKEIANSQLSEEELKGGRVS